MSGSDVGAPRSASLPSPTIRRLRAYAFDPSLDTRMDTAAINHLVIPVRWEGGLKAGPVGEYLEVVDVDPASSCAYDPIELNHPTLLAEDGLAPTTGRPQFHQQMVYAVAMTTISAFESSLGRRALWRPRDRREVPDEKAAYVPRLRIYPHALREANAYYSPPRKSLLFGYFPASADDPGSHVPGGMVFTCLSHDVVAHETTHALLDGLHPRYEEATNPDMLAFHEAFADLVALFQHFTFPEVLEHQIARTGGDLGRQSLLGQLAQEFGQAIGQRGALRDALGKADPKTGEWTPAQPDATALDATLEPHARGAILVAAVFDAFLSIYRARVADLLRIATAGTGQLPAGAQLHPDLVSRLAREAATAARHVLRMCIRALDYCPPVDLTFGEYLRALITADLDLVPDDTRGYRVAFLEAFRRRGIYPRDTRTLSVDTLAWQPPLDSQNQPITIEVPDTVADLTGAWDMERDREAIYHAARECARAVHEWLVPRGKEPRAEYARVMGLTLSKGHPPVEVHSVRPARRVSPDGGRVLTDLVIEITQTMERSLDAASEGGAPVDPERSTTFRGGCTLIVDLRHGRVRYAIRKDVDSNRRLASQLSFEAWRAQNALRSIYFAGVGGDEPFALLHRGPGEEVAW